MDFVHDRIDNTADQLRMEQTFLIAEYLERIAVALEKFAHIDVEEEKADDLYCGTCDKHWDSKDVPYIRGEPSCDDCGRPLRKYGGGKPDATGKDDSHN
jgi:hypothetical protein